MHNKLRLGIIAFVLLFVACANSVLKEHETGLRYKFFVEDGDAEKPAVGDIIAIKFKFTNKKGEVIEESDLFRTQLKEPSHAGGSIEDALALMHVGDSAMFLIKAENYYNKTRGVYVPKNIEPTEDLSFYIKMVDVMSFDDFAKERHDARISNEREEEKLLKGYLQRANITQESTVSGMYYVEKKPGNGIAAIPGKKVTVNYMGYFVDGKIFDSSYDRNQPFTFTLGVGEVIPGWDEGIAKMKEGGKAQLIIPSYLAYGDQQQGPVPPYATLIFDVELVKVHK